jgi:hypothetical protein
MLTVRTLSPYKDHSSLLRWQANMCSYCNYGITLMKVCCDFLECSTYFVVDGLILLFVALIELLGL